MCKRLERAGFVRLQHEGAIDFARRVAQLEPQCKQHLLAATRAFISLNYEPLSNKQRQAMLNILRAEVFKISYKTHLLSAPKISL
jgi:hypothetical protein